MGHTEIPRDVAQQPRRGHTAVAHAVNTLVTQPDNRHSASQTQTKNLALVTTTGCIDYHGFDIACRHHNRLRRCSTANNYSPLYASTWWAAMTPAVERSTFRSACGNHWFPDTSIPSVPHQHSHATGEFHSTRDGANTGIADDNPKNPRQERIPGTAHATTLQHRPTRKRIGSAYYRPRHSHCYSPHIRRFPSPAHERLCTRMHCHTATDRATAIAAERSSSLCWSVAWTRVCDDVGSISGPF